jgi:hypothetical protein
MENKLQGSEDIISHHDDEIKLLNQIRGAIHYQTTSDYFQNEKRPKKSDSYNDFINEIKAVIDGKNSEYKSDPIGVLSVDDLLCQIKIKGVRAQLAITREKRKDELLDIIVYSLLTMRKIEYDE